ncbi:MAG: aminoacyl-tRNA hydrolase [Clostridiales bacterium]|nr:aminoacyl-tRNA hydrolase [Clostridiales bacterium]
MDNIFDLFRRIASNDSPAQDVSPIEWLMVGLGNPGAEYARNRHNAGFIAVDHMSASLGFTVTKLKFRALTGECRIAGKRVLVMKPQTYMNSSGESVRDAADFYKIPPERILVVYDDISLPPGKMRIRRKGSPGGHNGIESIIYQLASDAFPRIKLGVGSPPPGYSHDQLISWVLGNIPDCDRDAFLERVNDVRDAAEMIISGDVDGAMGKFNGR